MQHGNEVAELIFHVSEHCHCLGDLITQQLPVTLTQSVECLFHCVFGYAKLGRYFCL